jgi:pimeloyl-ACP methyl ester carboxylesterase
MEPGVSLSSVPVREVESASGRLAFRRLGPEGGLSLLLCQRFRGTIDDWDPALVDVLAAERDVILFDSPGVSLSGGVAPATVAGMADAALELVSVIGLERLDLFGWSMGGFVAQAMSLARPDLVRRLIIAGSKPGPVPGAPSPDPEVGRVAGKPVNDADDLLYLFFPATAVGRAAGRASLQRLGRVQTPSTVAAPAVRAQTQALTSWSTGAETAWNRLEELTMPTLVAAGAHDRLMDAYHSYAMVRRMPNAELLLYGDAGHAFLFQHAARFGRYVLDFLTLDD